MRWMRKRATENISKTQQHDPLAALRLRDYRLFAIGLVLSTMGSQMQTVAIGWELYERTSSAMVLGWVGLVQVIPIIVLTLPAGQAADRLDRRRTVMSMQVMLTLCSLGLAVLSYSQGPLLLIYTCLLLTGVARAFNKPSNDALVPQLVPLDIFSNAATWNSSGVQLAKVLGPALGGLMIAVQRSATGVYLLAAVSAFACFVLISMVASRARVRSTEPPSFKTLAAGFSYVWNNQIILAAITLDLFAVLLGGAITLLPIFAKDILHVGPTGLGWLLAAPSIGALSMAITLAYLPPLKKAGKALLFAIAGFGVVTIVFGLSRSFWLSLLMLVLSGALDNINVVIRNTLVQIRTPDYLRGRVSALSSLFINSSNELGGFESGLVASIFGPVASVVSGGIGTIAVVIAVALIWPEIRQLGSLSPAIPAAKQPQS